MSLSLPDRIRRTELLDQGAYAPHEMRGNLADLRRYNGWLGGARVVIRGVGMLLGRNCSGRSISLLDVATGSADIPRALVRWGHRRGLRLLPVGLDVKSDVLSEACHVHRAPGSAMRFVQADARKLPFRDRAVDIVICSTFLHHLDRGDAVETLREMGRVARLGIVLVDLKRSRTAWTLLWLLTRLTTMNRLTRHDGPASVGQSFTCGELRRLAGEAGLAGAAVRDAGPARILLTYFRADTGRSDHGDRGRPRLRP
ncbi:MAG: methyltransferase domain-containing protein [Acidobacteriota bacterium]